MEKTIKVVGKLSDVELANALEGRKQALENDKSGIKERNILKSKLQKAEKERFQCYQAAVEEWAKKYTNYQTDVNDVRHHVNMLHDMVLVKLEDLPVNKLAQAKMVAEIEKIIDENNDVIEDKQLNTAAKKLLNMQEEAKERRKVRDKSREAASAKKIRDAEDADAELNQKLIEDIQNERMAKARKEYNKYLKEEKNKCTTPAPVRQTEPSPVKETDVTMLSQKKNDALNTIVAENEMILNVAGVNSNLLSFSSKVADIVRTKKMTYATIAKTKAGSLVIVCKKAGIDQENVRISYRDGRYLCSMANNTFCKYIRKQYGCNETDEYRFNIKCVAYADDIKIKIESINN